MYKAEFRKYGSTGTMIAKADTLDDLFRIITERGWRNNGIDRSRAEHWDEIATEGKKFYSINNDLTITKGENPMTEYTSL